MWMNLVAALKPGSINLVNLALPVNHTAWGSSGEIAGSRVKPFADGMPPWEFDQWFNFFEGCLWMAFAAVIGLRSRRMASRRGLARLSAAAFFSFGISDFIEISTRAWYEPLALAVFKGLCLAVLAGCLLRFWIRERRSETPSAEG
jgi:hypothetical protein